MDFQHRPVMLQEVGTYLKLEEGKIIIDGTLGGAGHSVEILRQIGASGLLIGIDQDREALAVAKKRLAGVSSRYQAFQSNYKDFVLCLDSLGIDKVDGFLLDLGVSSFQLDEPERGFSYQQDAPLDMRMNQGEGITAETIVNTWSEMKLAEIIWAYGEERWSKRIAKFIVEARQLQELTRTEELVNVIKAAIPSGARRDGPHPARRTFQALRIAVNDELGVLEETLAKVPEYLNPGGRVAIITFHSLEDRIVKQSFRRQAKACVCPPDFPVCRCEQVAKLKIITRRPILPSEEEVIDNPRARSAKLRVAERV